MIVCNQQGPALRTLKNHKNMRNTCVKNNQNIVIFCQLKSNIWKIIIYII